jgi:hypothetical protein
MQLFTTGLYMLNQDGTHQATDDNSDPTRVYTNDDIEEYARVWTGFESQFMRGNTESVWSNQIDPMQIILEYRDWYPKMGLNRQYIGDGWPLCADLPDQHFLKKGATYRLLGRTPRPELVKDAELWETDPLAMYFTLSANGSNSLFAKLCGSISAASCSYPAKVVLNGNLPCSGTECALDTVRVVKVNDMYYEFIRQACVHQVFFSNAKMVVRRTDWWGVSCADPRTQVASSACCDLATEVFEWNDQVRQTSEFFFPCMLRYLTFFISLLCSIGVNELLTQLRSRDVATDCAIDGLVLLVMTAKTLLLEAIVKTGVSFGRTHHAPFRLRLMVTATLRLFICPKISNLRPLLGRFGRMIRRPFSGLIGQI